MREGANQCTKDHKGVETGGPGASWVCVALPMSLRKLVRNAQTL